MNESHDASQAHDDIRLEEVLPLVEFGCWTAIVLFPFLYYINGPAVSTDQLVVRTALVMLTVTAAITLRVWNWRTRRK